MELVLRLLTVPKYIVQSNNVNMPPQRTDIGNSQHPRTPVGYFSFKGSFLGKQHKFFAGYVLLHSSLYEQPGSIAFATHIPRLFSQSVLLRKEFYS